jgi:hypothetical protein
MGLIDFVVILNLITELFIILKIKENLRLFRIGALENLLLLFSRLAKGLEIQSRKLLFRKRS